MKEIGFYMKIIHNQLETSFTRTFKKYGLTSTQVDVLEYIAQETKEISTLSNLATHFGVRHTSMIHVIKRLEAKGFIYRKNTAKDTRTKPIELTDIGLQIISVAKRNRLLLNQILLAGLSEDDQQSLTKMLDLIYRNLNSDAFKNLADPDNSKHQNNFSSDKTRTND